MPLLEHQALTLEGNAYNAAYYDYWNSTGADDGSFDLSHACFPKTLSITHRSQGQFVDAVIMPVAPHAPVIFLENITIQACPSFEHPNSLVLYT